MDEYRYIDKLERWREFGDRKVETNGTVPMQVINVTLPHYQNF